MKSEQIEKKEQARFNLTAAEAVSIAKLLDESHLPKFLIEGKWGRGRYS